MLIRTSIFTALAVIALTGCASRLESEMASWREHPKFSDPMLSEWQAEILDLHTEFVAHIKSREKLPDGCRPPEAERWKIASQLDVSREKFLENAIVSADEAVITQGECIDRKSVTPPYTAESKFRYFIRGGNQSTPETIAPETVLGRQIVSIDEGQVRRLSLSRHGDRYLHSIDQGNLRLQIALPLESPSYSTQSIDGVHTTISRDINAEQTRFLEFWGAKRKFEWQTLDGELHGFHVMYPSAYVEGSRTCYQNGNEAPASSCGPAPGDKSSGASVAAILGGLATAAAGHNAGLSESSSVDMGVRIARDIERGEISTDTYQAAQNSGTTPSQRSTIQAARELQASTEADNRSTQISVERTRRAGSVEERQKLNRSSDNSDAVSEIEYLRYTSPGGADRALPVDKSSRAQYAGLYANEYQDAAVADFRYQLNPYGTARLEHRACQNCTHNLDGSAQNRNWEEEYVAKEWAPMLTDTGEPMTRRIKDMNGVSHRARVLVVILEGGRTMSLNHYSDNGRAALGGPHGVPRYR